MTSTLQNGDADWLTKLRVTSNPLTLHAVSTARQFFERHMHNASPESQLSFLQGIDLQKDVKETVLQPGDEVAVFRFAADASPRCFYIKVGVPFNSGELDLPRDLQRFRVGESIVALESRCALAKTVWNDDPHLVPSGEEVQYIISDALESLKPIPSEWRRQPVNTLVTSDNGVAFLHRSEAQAGVSNRLHWPGGSSGVTIGAGYDMKERSPARIASDLMRVGVSAPVAEAASLGARLAGAAAKAFARSNKALILLTAEQEMRLLRTILPSYEAIVKRNVSVPLYQHEFDALASFVYNPGASFLPVARAINELRLSDAAAIMRERVMTGGARSPGLVNRRAAETNLLLHARYAH